jgi:hypothetical protein
LITNHLDIYVIASEAIIYDSLLVTVAGEEVVMEVSNAEEHVYRYDYEIYASGSLEIKAWAYDANLNRGYEFHDYAATSILAGPGGTALSPDGRLRVAIPAGALPRDAYILVGERGDPVGMVGRVYEVSPGGLSLDGAVEVAIDYDPGCREPQHLCIARIDGGVTLLLDSYLDRANRQVVAYVERLGSFGLLWDEHVESRDRVTAGLGLLRNSPNPFGDRTAISYTVSVPTRVRLEILSVEGRLVRGLVEGVVSPGTHRVSWDGTDQSGRPVASGVYLYRLSSGAECLTSKMVILR